MRFFRWKNKETGEEIIQEANEDRDKYIKLKRARTAARKFSNFVRMTGGDVKMRHITLTQETEGFGPGYLNSFLGALKRRYSWFAYFWTSEIQEGRLRRSGEAVLHWHLLIAVPSDEDVDFEDISGLWGRGFVMIKSVNNSGILKYLLKYITKDGEFFAEKKARKFGGSRIPSVFSLTLHQLRKALELVNFDFEILESYAWINGKGSMVLQDEETRKESRFKMIDVSFKKYYDLIFEWFPETAEPF